MSAGTLAGPQAPAPPDRRARDAALVAAVTVASSLLGLLRDTAIAGLFGASAASDAFFVAWTVPETVTPLLNESGLALLLTPLFARVWARDGSLTAAVRRTLLPVVVVTGAAGALSALAAPLLVRLLAPGLSDPGLAATCFRLASVTVLGLGVAGYLSSALRGRGSFVRPALTYVAYNVGILGCLLLEPWLGVRAAALGLAVGSLLMVLVVAPAVLRSASLSELRWSPGAGLAPVLAVAPIVVYSLGRQGQVFAERWFGSDLVGAISELNYAAKVSQIPVTMALVVSSVSIAAVTTHLAARRFDPAIGLTVDAFRTGACLVVPCWVALEVLAPQIVGLLFQRGAFDAELVGSTATVMRFFALGLPGQLLVGASALFLCVHPRGARAAAGAAVLCLAVTVGADALLVGPMGAPGLALGNAVGMTVTGVVMVLLLDAHTRRACGGRGLPWGRLADAPLRSLLAAAVAGAAAFGVSRLGGSAVVVVLSGLVFVAVHVVVAHAVGLAEVRALVGHPVLRGAARPAAAAAVPDAAPRRRARWSPAVVPLAVGLVLGLVVTVAVALARPAEHRATALVVVTTGAGGTAGAGDATATTQALTRLAASLAQPYRDAPHVARVLVEGVPSSPVVQITVDGSDPAAAREVADAVAGDLVEASAGTSWSVAERTPAAATAVPRPRVGPGLLVVGAGTGVLLAVGLAGVLGRWPGSAPHRPWPAGPAGTVPPRPRRRAAHRRTP
ncbi:lipid II flippase MurJ [Kineococcus sp. SYSU DK001]|uniref:lipid II flippase MurJ n=1 Tax=Kineococcus sp. SYSU DK001 TaxID=3383122 RepID=UPI003D7EB487